LLETSHMYRSSLTLAFVVLCSAAAAASDLSSVYVAPGALRGTRLRISAALLWDAGPRISCTGIGLWRVRTGLRRAAGLCRTRTRLSRALLRSGAVLRAGTRLCAGVCAEAASARTLPCAGAMRRRRRLWQQVGLLRLNRVTMAAHLTNATRAVFGRIGLGHCHRNIQSVREEPARARYCAGLDRPRRIGRTTAVRLGQLI